MGILSDDEFRKVDRDTYFEEVEKQVSSYEQEQERAYQNSYAEEPTEPVNQESNSYDSPTDNQDYSSQMNYGAEQDNTTTSDAPSEIDPSIYEDAYKKMTSPFKASGREFQVRNVDEAISLMQKGVDYTRKLQGLKPRLMEMRALESQNMLGSNLNYAIDIFNGKPEAIAKLIKDKNIDINSLVQNSNEVDDFGNPIPAKQVNYVPTDYSISPSEYEFKEVVDELKSTDSFDKVANAIESMDPDSRQKFISDPKKLLAIKAHIESGLYKDTMDELNHARIVDSPYIRGLSDFEAYEKIGQYIYNTKYAQNKPVNTQQPSQQQQQQQYMARQQQQVQQRKQGVSPIRANHNSKPIINFDPLTCSDEDFAKIDPNMFYK